MPKIAKYLLFTFISSYTIQLIAARDLNTGIGSGVTSLMLALGMFLPTIGVLIAGADLRNMGWLPQADKPTIKLTLFAWLFPTASAVLGAALFYMAFPEDFSPEGGLIWEMGRENFDRFIADGGSCTGYIIKEIFLSITSFSTFFAMLLGLGEEIGWRGFLFPELKERLGRTRGVLLGGVIHGAWHFPGMLLFGYEYGKNYIGAPLLGLFVFCIFTTAMGIICDFLYEKSHCILLPAIFHGAINAEADAYLVHSGEHLERKIFGPVDVGLISVIPLVITAIVILCIQNRRDEMEFADFDA